MSVGSLQKRVDARLEAAKIFWGYGHCRSIQLVADVADSLQDTYFDVNVILGSGLEKKYIFYFDTDPAIAGTTGVQIPRTTGDSAAVLAAAFQTAAASVEIFISVSGDTATIENWYPGPVTAETDSGSTGFTFAVLREGAGGDLGATSEGSELTLETNSVEINSNQTGSLVLDDILTGNSVELSVSLLEMTAERWSTIVANVSGDSVDISGGEVVGFGESRLYQSAVDLGGRLILHPIRLGDSDRSADICFWRSAPLPESINFSGDEPQAMSVTFKPYLASEIDTAVNLFAYGDWTADELRV